MSSSGSSGISSGCRGRGGESEKGIPRKCRCGANSMIQTSNTLKNPGRIFYCCLFGSHEEARHLFKWSDISMVEEIEEVENVVEKIQVDVGSLEKGLHDIDVIKAITQVCEKEIAELKAMVFCYEKEIEALRCFKNMVMCGLFMGIGYYFIFA
ncbi:hypothetical protein V5N11_007455 [Cardamine amara subsp. amara]|uniref:GRF-type domain-containing protein n=1 Tax=Cardamine amara subsp. amara TaxID=228776 RepID=A0ABD1BU09_CARAN